MADSDVEKEEARFRQGKIQRVEIKGGNRVTKYTDGTVAIEPLEQTGVRNTLEGPEVVIPPKGQFKPLPKKG